jgi:uncharacterized protein
MDLRVPQSLADSIFRLTPDSPVSLVWHGGEPLTTGIPYFTQLILPFGALKREGRVVHEIQTNATLIDDEWCRFFVNHDFKVGVSIDGPGWAKIHRADWGKKASYDQAMKGIARLKTKSIPFSAIAVIGSHNITRASELYEFFCTLGCTTLGVNIEEREGINLHRNTIDDARVDTFWRELYAAWHANPAIRIREFDRVISYSKMVLDDGLADWNTRKIDIFPTIAWNGDVYFLSPELANAKALIYDDFIAGNVLSTPLEHIIRQADSLLYVRDFLSGIKKCREVCDHFDFCHGGQASNKFFECGTVDATETMYCRNSKKKLMKAFLDCL